VYVISSVFVRYFKFLPVTDYICWQAIKLNLMTTPIILVISSSSSSNKNCH